jgi:hypothetical protein
MRSKSEVADTYSRMAQILESIKISPQPHVLRLSGASRCFAAGPGIPCKKIITNDRSSPSAKKHQHADDEHAGSRKPCARPHPGRRARLA